MYLLKLTKGEQNGKASINLHSTMYLLKPRILRKNEYVILIYIPLCIY